MSVRRDPETGKFVSADSAQGMGWNNLDHVSGARVYEIPAADLSGTTEEQIGSESDNTTIIDFSEVLDSDEVFEVVTAYVDVSAYAHTTASAEGYVSAYNAIDSDLSDLSSVVVDSPFFGTNAATVGENDIADTLGAQSESDGRIWSGRLVAEPSYGDSTNGLGAGSNPDRVRKMIPLRALYGSGPVYDQDDEIYAASHLNVDNVSDHAVGTSFYVDLRGRIQEVE